MKRFLSRFAGPTILVLGSCSQPSHGPGLRESATKTTSSLSSAPSCALLDDPQVHANMSAALEVKLQLLCGRVPRLPTVRPLPAWNVPGPATQGVSNTLGGTDVP